MVGLIVMVENGVFIEVLSKIIVGYVLILMMFYYIVYFDRKVIEVLNGVRKKIEI